MSKITVTTVEAQQLLIGNQVVSINTFTRQANSSIGIAIAFGV
jgi:hypothetical protein